MRGRASGTCLVSHLKLMPYPNVQSDLAEQSSRLVEGIVHLGRGVHMFVASVYGPTHTTTFYDPWSILSKLCAEVFDHAMAFKGPAVVMGDFNVCIDDVPRWNALKRLGWVDAAAFDAVRRQCEPSPTSKDKARKSFILINPALVQSLLWCDTIEEHEFDSHPLLAADFDLDVVMRPITRWWLPVTTDTYMFDSDLLEEHAVLQVAKIQPKFQNAIQRKDGEEALRQFNLAFENCLQSACVDSTGRSVVLPRRCTGRGRKCLSKQVRPSAPVIKPARSGQFTPDVCQPSAIIRNMTKQVRRLQSLESQLAASLRHNDLNHHDQCDKVWNAALLAKGFFPSFQEFVLNSFGIFVPIGCPGVEYVHYLSQVLTTHLQTFVAEHNKAMRFARECKILKDIQQGGSAAYQSVKDHAAPPFHAIVTDLSARVVRQKWPKEGRTCLKVASCDGTFDFQYPVYFQGQECFVTHVEQDCWHLDRPVKWRFTDQMQITQKRVVADHEQLQQLTGQAWSELWMREPVDDSPEQWEEAFSSLRQLPDLPSLEFQPLTAEEWKRHARTVPRKSARGSCAFTAKELLLMPDRLVEWLLVLLTAIENGSFPWPKALMVARVVMLAKTETQPTCPLKTRPITIASRIYRNWARCRSLQIIQHLQRNLPATVAGSAAGISADLLSAKVLFDVEQAIITSSPILGLTVDLIKCFNAIPRIPVLHALRKMGVPDQYLNALSSMYQQLRRMLELAGEVGREWPSTTGVPEGCAMSLVAMLSITAWAASHVQAAVGAQAIDFSGYADNWSLLTRGLEDLKTGIRALFSFVRMLRMKIAADKSWTWSTDAKFRRQLQDMEIEGVTIPMKLVACDLGCDVTYCRKVTKKVTKGRLAKTARVLKRVGSKRLPKRFKTTMTAQLSSSVPGYGSELVYHTPSELRVLRSATCRALGRSRSGNNPFLSTLMTERIEDVSLGFLRRKVMFWRRFLKAFPQCTERFLATLDEGRNRTGVTAFLRRSFADHGWTCGPFGALEHNRGWKMNWVRDSKCHVRKLLSLAWNVVACGHVKHRPNFNALCVDVRAFHNAIGPLEERAKTDALNLATGKHVTNDALVHYSKGAKNNLCPFCKTKDGRLHRVFHCKHTQSHRDKYSEMMQWLHEQETIVAAWGLLPIELDWADWCYGDSATIPAVVTPDRTSDDHHDVFTDGSSTGNTHTGFTVAAAAFVHCKGYKVLTTRAEPMPGNDHSAYRAETWGVIMALSTFRFVHIYTDCSSVVCNLSAAISARKSGSCPRFTDHEDLWGIVWRLVLDRETDAVIVTKVKAHQDVSAICDPTLRWKAVMNDKADKLAKACIKRHWGLDLDAIVDRLSTRDKDIVFLRQFHSMWHEINLEALQKSKKNKEEGEVGSPAFRLSFDPGQAVCLSCAASAEAIHAAISCQSLGKALNQFGDDLGSSLDRCPFVNGLTRSEHVCLVVDRQIGSLTRTWCAFELQLSAEEKKTLDLYSPTGKVGTEGGASSVALLDAVEAWDIRDTDTSNAADRRQIFNRIAGVDELSGIRKDPEGRPLMDRGKKKLEDDGLDPAGRLRSRTKTKGKVEYAHEARLVQDKCSNFEAINSLVRGKVKESFAKQHESRGCRIEDHTLRGIPLGQLKKFFRQAMRELRGQWKDLTVQKLEEYVNVKLSPKICGVNCSYVETVVEKPMPPTVYLAFASDGNVPELVKGVEWLAEARELDDDTAFFFEILCLSQEEVTSINTYSYHKVASSESQGILVAHGCDRAWVLCDLAYFLREDKFVDLGCPNGVLACTLVPLVLWHV
eukprot:s604_g18.t1